MTHKELVRRFNAETVGRLTALGVILAVIWLFGDKDSDMTKAAAPNNKTENIAAKQAYADSVRNINAFKIDTLQSRSK